MLATIHNLQVPHVHPNMLLELRPNYLLKMQMQSIDDHTLM